MTISDQTILGKTRAEEHDADVWGEFYIPPYFKRLALQNATKSTYIVGKRGCGKTMLLKYLDYHTAFSKKRETIPNDEISHIGIYWRVDTQFCNSLNHRGLTEHEWISIYESYFSLVIAVEIIRSLRVIAESTYSKFTLLDFENLELSSIPDFHPDYPSSPQKLERHLESIRRKFTSWISNILKMEKPILPPGKAFLDSLIEDLKKHKGLENASFFIYVDEVENLVPYQRHVLNSYLKHSQRPLIVSFTSKVLSDDTATTGPESINGTHDFRVLFLDELSTEEDKKMFFSEVFLANIDLASNKTSSNLLKALRNLDSIEERSTTKYKANIASRIKAQFPTKTLKQLAHEAISQDRIYNILRDRIKQGLETHSTQVTFDDFMQFKNVPEALVILPALLNRSKNKPEKLIISLSQYSEKTTNPFKDWVHNNLFGSLLELYRPYGGRCPVYSGFDTFFTMANDNLRNFLILCYKAIEVAELEDENVNEISLDIQALAAYEAADRLIKEIKTIGAYGEQLRMFVLRLGNVFRSLQSVPSMSESEQNQFTINSGGRMLNEIETTFLAEAQKHGIITERLETKTKGVIGTDIVDYQLNPIYSPYFQISYRRKRKIELSVEQFHVLALGPEDNYKELTTNLFKVQGLKPTQTELWQ